MEEGADCTVWAVPKVSRDNMASYLNQSHSLQLFVVEFDTCLVWELLLLPSNGQTALNMPSLKGTVGDTSED